MATAVPASTSTVPSNMSLAQIVREALNFISAITDSDLGAVAKTGVNAGIGLINARNWKKVYNIWTITLVADDDDYELPTDYKEPIVLLRLNSSSKREGRIRYLPTQTFFQELTDNTQAGDPSHYTIDYQSRLLVLSVDPASSYVSKYPTLRHLYHKRTAKLAQDSDTTGLPPEFDEWLVLHAAARLAQIYDQAKVSAIRSDEREMWRWLRTSDSDTITDYS